MRWSWQKTLHALDSTDRIQCDIACYQIRWGGWNTYLFIDWRPQFIARPNSHSNCLTTSLRNSMRIPKCIDWCRPFYLMPHLFRFKTYSCWLQNRCGHGWIERENGAWRPTSHAGRLGSSSHVLTVRWWLSRSSLASLTAVQVTKIVNGCWTALYSEHSMSASWSRSPGSCCT